MLRLSISTSPSSGQKPWKESSPHPTCIQALRVGGEERVKWFRASHYPGSPTAWPMEKAAFSRLASCFPLSPHSAQWPPCSLHPEWGCHMAHPFPSTLEEKCQGEGLRDLQGPSVGCLAFPPFPSPLLPFPIPSMALRPLILNGRRLS